MDPVWEKRFEEAEEYARRNRLGIWAFLNEDEKEIDYMKPVEGIKLEDVVNEAVQDVAKEHKTRIFTQIRSILTDLRNWRAEQEKSEKALEKLKGKILAAEKKVEELKGGKWDALAESQQSKPQEPTTPDQSS